MRTFRVPWDEQDIFYAVPSSFLNSGCLGPTARPSLLQFGATWLWDMHLAQVT